MSALPEKTASETAFEGPVLKQDNTPLKILYALDSFPQLSESYINAEIERMKSWGVQVEVWSKDEPKSPANIDVIVHRGLLVDTIREVKPDIVHTHWTKSALKYKDAAKRMGLPLTARGHWHFVTKQLQKIENDVTIERLYMYPHLASKYGSASSKILPMTACFHHEWLAPRTLKNRKMIVRTAACKKPKDLATFIRIAEKLPDYRFVMILCSLGPNDHYRELEQLNRDLGSPVEMIHDISYPEVAAYLAEAGIYLHTYSPTVSFGMPVSIAEAMAAGCSIIARDLEGAADYIGDAGRLYANEEEAITLVRATEAWTPADWAEAERKSRERAFNRFDDRSILVPLLEDWKSIAKDEIANRGRKRVSVVTQLRRWLGIGYARV